MARNPVIPFLVAMMLATGVCNTILNKYQDMQCVRNCESADPKERRTFEQPVIQTLQMFIGEMGCWLVVLGSYIYRRYVLRSSEYHSPLLAGGYHPVQTDDAEVDGDDNEEEDDAHITNGNGGQEGIEDDHTKPVRTVLRGWKIFLLAMPSCCDIAGTTLMNVGLLFVAASIYQMTRGALVLFVGLFSVLFLRRKLHIYQWLALCIVVLGVAVVGLAGALFGHDSSTEATTTTVTQPPEAVQAVIGVLLIAAAQIFTATQFVLEEWILEHYAMDPLQVVGWEGIFGFSVTFVGMIVMYFVVGRTPAGQYGYFDLREGWREVHNPAVAWSSLAIMISIGGFNFFGLSVTRTVSATSRSTIDTCRTLFIWIVSLGLGWESFKWLQVLGFVMLVYGTFLFNDIIAPPLKACLPSHLREGEVLLPEEPIEHM